MSEHPSRPHHLPTWDSQVPYTERFLHKGLGLGDQGRTHALTPINVLPPEIFSGVLEDRPQ